MLVAGATAVSLSGCGADDAKKSSAAPSTQNTAPSSDGDLPEPQITDNVEPTPLVKGRPLPTVKPSQVKTIVGKWVSGGKVEDYFLFKADGTGAWMARGKPLWTGRVIPAGGGRYRLSWNNLDTVDATYWAVALDKSGAKLVFEGTQQTYTKAAAATP